MAEYRFYGIAPEQHRVLGRNFICDNDDKALLLGQAMLGNFKACEIWQRQRYVGVAMPICANAPDGQVLADAADGKHAIAERGIRDAIAYYQNRRGWLMRHERLKLHILQRDLSRLLETAPDGSTPIPTPDPGATVHYFWAWQSGDLK